MLIINYFINKIHKRDFKINYYFNLLLVYIIFFNVFT